MKTYEEMTQIVLTRIEEERIPRWKLILSSVIKHLITLVLIILIITFCFFIIERFFLSVIWVLECG